jgi:acetylornithine deacetylase/succinyl-diaminopimelate desuccinylase-like protein
MMAELREIVGPDPEISYSQDGGAAPANPDMSLFSLLADIIREKDADAIPIPFLLPAVTDGRWFARLGIQPYGFTPLLLPHDFAFQAVVHAADERVTVEAIRHGADMVYELLTRYEG